MPLISDHTHQERARCLAILRSVPYADNTLREVYLGLIEHGIPADRTWSVVNRGQIARKGHKLRRYVIQRPQEKEGLNLGFMLHMHMTATWDAVVYDPENGMDKTDQREDFPDPFSASAWVVDRWDELVKQGSRCASGHNYQAQGTIFMCSHCDYVSTDRWPCGGCGGPQTDGPHRRHDMCEW